MKTLLLLSLIISTHIFARIVDERWIFADYANNSLTGSFGYDKNIQRTWLEVERCELQPGEAGSFCSTERVLMDELKLVQDAQDSNIFYVTFNKNKDQVVCLVIEKKNKKIIKKDKTTETGNCNFYSDEVVKRVDDGFRVSKVKYTELYFRVVAP